MNFAILNILLAIILDNFNEMNKENKELNIELNEEYFLIQ